MREISLICNFLIVNCSNLNEKLMADARGIWALNESLDDRISWDDTEKSASEGYFPHLLPLKAGGEGNISHLHFSHYLLQQHNNDLAQSIQNFIANFMVLFICFQYYFRQRCAAELFHFVFFKLFSLPNIPHCAWRKLLMRINIMH